VLAAATGGLYGGWPVHSAANWRECGKLLMRQRLQHYDGGRGSKVDDAFAARVPAAFGEQAADAIQPGSVRGPESLQSAGI